MTAWIGFTRSDRIGHVLADIEERGGDTPLGAQPARGLNSRIGSVAGDETAAPAARDRGCRRPHRDLHARVAKALTATGALVAGLGGRRRRVAAMAGGALVLAGELCLRWSVFKAGFQSARDPKYTVEPQRHRLAERASVT